MLFGKKTAVKGNAQLYWHEKLGKLSNNKWAIKKYSHSDWFITDSLQQYLYSDISCGVPVDIAEVLSALLEANGITLNFVPARDPKIEIKKRGEDEKS